MTSLVWLEVSAIAHGRQVRRGFVLVEAATFEEALPLATAAGALHAEDLVAGFALNVEAVPATDRVWLDQIPRLTLLSVQELEAVLPAFSGAAAAGNNADTDKRADL